MKYLPLFFLFLTAILSKADPYQVFEENGKVGIKNEHGQIIIPPSFEALGWSDGNFSVIGQTTGYRLNEQWGLINLKREFITTAIFESLTFAGGDYVIARKKINPAVTKIGCLNLRGEVKLPFVYDGIQVQGLRAIVFNLQGAKFNYGLTDLQNNVLIPIIFRNIYPLGTLRYAVENQDGKIALFSEDGKSITDFKIDSVSRFYKNYSIVYGDGLQGLIDREGEMKLPTHYRSVRIIDDGVISVQSPSEWLGLNDKNQIVTKLIIDDLLPINDHYKVQSVGKYGLMDKNQKILLPVQFDQLHEIDDHKFIAEKNDKWGLIEENNRILIPFEYDSICPQQNNLQGWINYKGWHLLDSVGKIKTNKFYDYLGEFDGSTFKVQSKGYWGLVDKNGEEIVHCVFDSIADRKFQMVAVKFKGQYGIIDLRESWKVAPQPYPIQLANDNRYVLFQPGNAFLKDFESKIIYFTPNRMEFKSEFWLEFLPDGTEKTISYDGVMLKRTEFQVTKTNEEVFVVSEGLRGIRKDGKYGFIDEDGKLRIANRYDSIGDFREGLAPIKLIGKWGFINSQDKIVVQPNYETVTSFSNGISIVTRNGKFGLIDKSGNALLPLRYETVQLLPNLKFLLIFNQLKGIANEKGNVDIEPRFDYLENLSNGFLIVGSAGKLGLITAEGLDRIPMIYDKLIFDKSKNQYLAMRKSEWKELKLK